MSQVHKNFLLTAVILIVSCCCQAAARADPLILTLNNPVQSGAPGRTLNFSASVFNSGASSSDVDLISGFGINVGGGAPDSDILEMPFDSNFAARSVASGGTLGPLNLFAIFIPNTAAVGTIYTGRVFVEYSNSAGGPIKTNTETFTINVTAPTATPVPEPATLLLLGTGLAGLGARLRMRGKATPKV